MTLPIVRNSTDSTSFHRRVADLFKAMKALKGLSFSKARDRAAGVCAGVMTFLLLLVSMQAEAAWVGVLNLGYDSDAFKVATTSTTGMTHYAGILGLELDKKGDYVLGYSFGSSSHSENDGTTPTTFTTTELGPYFIYYMNRSRSAGLHLGYNLQSTAKYNDGTTPQEWSGTSISVGLSLETPVSEGIWFGFKLTMYSMTYSRDITLGATSTSIAYSRQWLAPLLTMSFR